MDIITPRPATLERVVRPMQRQPLQTQSQPRSTVSQSAPAPPQPIAPRPGSRKRHNRTQLALLVMAVIVFGMGVFASIKTLQDNHAAKKQLAELSNKVDNDNDNSGDVPSETKPGGKLTDYQVAPLLPKFIKIGKLGVNARIKPLGVTADNQLQAPTNIYDAGWYNASARPGDSDTNGAILIDGHVHGPTLPGVFSNLKQLQIGDSIEIARGDNQVFAYQVVKVQDYDAKTLNLGIALVSAQPGKPGLNLITCSGSYNRATNQYAQRTIVFAVQQG